MSVSGSNNGMCCTFYFVWLFIITLLLALVIPPAELLLSMDSYGLVSKYLMMIIISIALMFIALDLFPYKKICVIVVVYAICGVSFLRIW